MQSLIEDPRYFAQVDLSKTFRPEIDWSTGVTRVNIEEVVLATLGSNHPLRPACEPSNFKKANLRVYDMLSNVLPDRSPQTDFFWTRFCRPFASMLQSSGHSLQVQARFLIFLWARIIGFMGPLGGPEQHTMLTQDGSPIEASWVIPPNAKAVEGEATRSLRFALEPTDPRDGKFLRGARVMDYITSTVGGLGVVFCPPGALDWRSIVDKWLYGHVNAEDDDVAVESSGFFLGFGLSSSGHIALKSYFQPPFPSPNAPTSVLRCPIHVGDPDFSPLRAVVSQLDASMAPAFDYFLEYLSEVEPAKRPIFHMLAMDVVRSSKNRLKIYVQTRNGFAWPDVKRNMTMGGRIESPEMDNTINALENLWNNLFPTTDSSSGLELIAQTQLAQGEFHESEEHPPGVVGYYFELAPGNPTVMPKVYFPVRHWCSSDKFVTDAVEDFYRTQGLGGPSTQGEQALTKGWCHNEIARAFNHRPLDQKPGMATWVTFGHKKKGWELTSYYSPELFAQ